VIFKILKEPLASVFDDLDLGSFLDNKLAHDADINKAFITGGQSRCDWNHLH
jgi:hypothetical protein